MDQTAKKCEENTTSIALIKSTLDYIGNPNGTVGSTTSELLISGVSDVVASELSPSQGVKQVFEKLELSNLENDVLSTQIFGRKENQARKPSSCTYILNLKSHQVRDYIIEVKRRSQRLLAKETFKVIGDIPPGKQVFINEFLNADTYKLLKLAKAKARDINCKYAWVHKGVVYMKKNDDSSKIVIRTEDDVNKIE
ncbi:uncharacterized protein LOC141529537 [Cotesia typhae]|uniref:uncharacterized protein LOC141529537 n=1 Tax=Cotesia typhae TaxID=2053667 RepID=UPI003D69E9E9